MEASVLSRLEELRAERAKGLQRLDELAREFDTTRETVLRINGGIQVLEELLAAAGPAEPAGPAEQPAPAVPAG